MSVFVWQGAGMTIPLLVGHTTIYALRKSALLVAQCLYRIELRGFAGGVKAEEGAAQGSVSELFF